MTTPTNVTFRLRRFDPATQQEPVWEDFTIPYTAGMTVLDGLRKIKETVAPAPGVALVVPDGRVRVVRHVHQRASTPRVQHADHRARHLHRHGGAAAQLRDHPGPGPGPAADVRRARRADAPHHPRGHGGDVRADRRVLPDAARTRAVPAVHLLHQVRLLHGGVPDGGDRPGVLGADAARAIAPLQRRQPRRRDLRRARRCWPRRRGRGSATTRASARRPAPRASTRPGPSS